MPILNRQTIAAFLLGSALAVGAGAYAVDRHLNPHGEVDAAAHVDRMLKHLYVEIDASDAQQARIGPLVKQAMQDLAPLHEQLRTAHQQAMTLLTQPTIDHAALEAARVADMQLADQASKRLVQLMADVGDVLSADQRGKLATHLARLRGGRGGAMHGRMHDGQHG